jgi:hypothetical protein
MGLLDRRIIALRCITMAAQHGQLMTYRNAIVADDIAGVGQTGDRPPPPPSAGCRSSAAAGTPSRIPCIHPRKSRRRCRVSRPRLITSTLTDLGEMRGIAIPDRRAKGGEADVGADRTIASVEARRVVVDAEPHDDRDDTAETSGAPLDTSTVIEVSTRVRRELLRGATSVSCGRLHRTRRCRRSSGSLALPTA